MRARGVESSTYGPYWQKQKQKQESNKTQNKTDTEK
jgi:hypothetical protein